MPEVRSTSVPVARESLLLLNRRRAWRRRAWAALLAAAALLVPTVPARSASTGTTQLVTPQGSSAGTANGDFISSNSPGGLDEPYRYFIEVTPGLSRLVIELFDADFGDGTGEDTAGRDRDRAGGFDGAATYTLVNPGGATRNVEFTTGNATGPTGADNAWLALFDSTGDTVRDEFGAIDYGNDDGTVSWAADWDETNDNDDPADGQIRITGGELRLGDNGGTASTIHREANLSGNGFSTASLTFNLRTTGVDAGDQFRLEVSANGGGSWTTLETFTGAYAATSRTYDISAYIATNTRIRFIEINGYGNNDFLFIDNLQIRETSIDAGHWELRVDQSDGGGDEINALGIRAHDGNSGSGGTELNVYYDSHNQYGVNPSAGGANSRSYDYYPYITSGCTAGKNDFDYDSNSGNVGSLAFASRTGAFTQTFTSSSLSTNDNWRRDTINRWTTDQASTEYGIWHVDADINTYTTPAVNGNYANLYISSFQAAAGDPTSNPTADAFRVYLPTDAGAAPVKPYLEQLLTHKSGTNPVLVGQTSRYQVTVRLVNPTPHAITFSTPTNVVTARVPGSGAVYAGNAAVGQGSITSQPAVGSTGDVIWNPGTLAAGATAVLTYQVDISPTSAGQRILATSTPASGNGTRARFVDETGNTTQARATYLAGPVCELGVTEGLLTEAVIASFRARQEGGAVVLEWRTASEAGTAGFYLYGRDARGDRFEPLHEGLLPGLLHAPQGGTYRFVDASASPRQRREYLLVEVELAGGRREHGPFRPAVEWGKSALEPGLSYERVPHPAKAAPRSRRARTPETIAAAASAPGSPKALRVSVRESGLYLIPSADMASLFGTSLPDLEKKVMEGKLSLTRGGRPVGWYPFFSAAAAAAGPRAAKGAQGIYFYGEALDSLYTLDNVYRLELGGSGLLMQVAAVAGPGAATPAASFAEVRASERDLLPATAVATDPESDYWFWDFLQAGDATHGRKTFSLDAPGLAAAPGGAASLTVRLFGATTTGVTGEHHVSVSLNGTPLGDTAWQGIAPRTASFAVDPALLLETGNQVEVTALLDAGVPYSISYVDSFELGYPRTHQAAGDALAFTGTGAPVSVAGLSAAPVLLDVSVPARPRWLTGATVEADGAGGFRAGFSPAPAGGRYLTAGPGSIRRPALRAWREAGLASATNGADYLVITTADLRTPAQRLANYRAAQGLESLVVDVEAIYDEFNAGLAGPHALRAFLAHARRTWRKAPRYVVLAGAGSLDYRDLLGYGGGLVPPLLVRSSGGLFVSDNAVADVAGNDGLPEMAIGRLPVRTAAELNAYVDKLARAEAATVSGAPWRGHVLLLSDAPDRGATFGADSEKVGARIPGGYAVDRIDLATEPAAAARGRLFAALAQGASLVNFLGHGGLDRLSGAGLLASDDVPGLAGLPHGNRLPVFTAMTCTVNRFGVPGVSSLGELLVRQAGGGATAVWSPSGLSLHGEAVLLAERFYQQATNPAPATRLGDLVLRSLGDLKTLGGSRSMLDVYNLLGDPALLMQQPVPAPPAGGNGGGE